MTLKSDALDYHRTGRHGKIEVVPTKPCATQRDLSLAYTPGVAEPCREIQRDPLAAFDYTSRANLVGVVSNGTAVLGLGNIGALAGKPVMEGTAVLFTRFADIDVFDIELDSTDPETIIQTVKLLEPTFGGINLEDIAAPDCFRIEEELVRTMAIPVFHDDQHGTAIISGAALLNGLELAGKKLTDCRIVVSGAGAAGIACSRLIMALGARREQFILVDTAGVVYQGREKGMNKYKQEFATGEKCRSLAEAVKNADVFIGVSAANILTPDMVRSMARTPIVLAMANPDPEITYPEARSARSDVIIATGRSDYPNQVNNCLGFPFIFRGALDARARCINTEMKLAAVHALADLAKQAVPETVARAYHGEHFHFGPDYIIPKPFDPRVLIWEATAVARAAVESGVARLKLDLAEYREALEARLGPAREAMRSIVHVARRRPGVVVYPEGTHPRILKAAAVVVEEGIGRPVLVGGDLDIRAVAAEHDVDLSGITIASPGADPRSLRYAGELYRLRQRRGVTLERAGHMIQDPTVFAAMMLRLGEADGFVGGVTRHFPDTVRPVLQIIGPQRPGERVAAVYLVTFRNRSFFIADAGVNIEPDAACLAGIAILTAGVARRFEIEPRVAMLSFSNFGSVDNRQTRVVREAVAILSERAPGLVVDGEMQADTAVAPDVAAHFPFSRIQGNANVLVFPDLASANIACKLLHRLSGAEVVGPILVGLAKPAQVLVQSSDVTDIVNLTALAVTDGQVLEAGPPAERGGAPASDHRFELATSRSRL